MDAAAFEQVYKAFGEFHPFFAPLFGRRESRDHSENYVRALLLQSQDRRNAENLSESVGVSARAMQRFFTKAPCPLDDDTAMGRLQEYLGASAGAPGGAVGAGRQRFPQAGTEVGGGGPAVLRPTGKGGQLLGRDVPGLRQPASRAA